MQIHPKLQNAFKQLQIEVLSLLIPIKADYLQYHIDFVGVVHAAINLGKMYYEGAGVQKDVTRSLLILNKFQHVNSECKQLYDEISLSVMNKKS